MNDRELLELIATQVGTLTNDMKEVKGEMKEVKERVVGLENRMIKMEDDNHRNFTALFDGYKQNSEQLNRIEKEVSKHEEIILRRVK